jgi:LPS sulfotransferase NodH
MPSTIIICGTQRCGSTMVCEDLTSTGVLGRPEEYFLSWKPTPPDSGAEVDWRSKFDDVIAKATTPNGVRAFKLMANQLRHLDACLRTFIDPVEDMAFPHIVGAFPDAIWVWISRRDRLDQAISHVVARSTGVYHAVKRTSGFVPGSAMTETGYRNAEQNVAYDFRAFISEWHTINTANLAWQGFFARNRIKPLHLLYEDIISPKGRQGYVSQIGARAKVEIPPLQERNLTKLSNPLYADFRKRILADLLDRV